MFDEIRSRFDNGSAISRLIIINVALFATQSILFLVFTIAGAGDVFSSFLNRLYVPSSAGALLRQPWSLLTYQFLHDPFGIFHILFNMLYLWWFGRIATEFIQERYITPLYLTGGLAGALLFILIYTLSPAFGGAALLVGASASVLAIVVAAATIVPDYTVHLILIGPVRLKWIALIAVLIDIVGITSGANVGGHLAHLGGALCGFLFIYSYQRGVHWFDGILAWTDYLGARMRNEPRVVYVNKEKQKPAREKASRQNTSEADQAKMDAILDKISASGYDSLSTEEKNFLFRISKDK